MNPFEQIIDERLRRYFAPEALMIENESPKHHGHRSNPGGIETHFKITMISKEFKDLSRIERHRKVQAVLKDLMNNPIHALSLSLFGGEQISNF